MSSSSVASLSKQLSSLSKTASTAAATAKAQGKDTTGITNAINKSNAMVSQTNRQGSKSFSGSKEETAYNANVITPANLAPIAPVKLPTPTIPTGTPNIGALNSALSNPDTGLTVDNVGGFTVAPIAQAQMDANQSRLDKYMADLTSANANKTSAIDIQKKLDKQTGIDALKSQEADYTSQINSIVKNSEAAKLALEGQGRGQTTGFLGGEQARIGREAAIQALPVQAQLASVQGKIQVATDYINKWGALLVQDANDKYNFKVNTIKAVYDFGTAQDKIKFDDLASQAKAKKDAEVALANAKTKAISQALSQPGGNAVVQAIQNATDENGVVAALGKYNGDILAQEAQRANIAQSYASIANSNTDRLIKLASAGDKTAITKLGFDPNAIVNESTINVQKLMADPVATSYDKNSSVITALLSPKSKVSEGARTSMATTLGVINSLNDIAIANPGGSLAGVNPGRALLDVKIPFTNINVIPFRDSLKQQATVKNEGYINAINLKVQQWASGASLTADQTKKVNELVPNVYDTDSQFKTKMNNLADFMLTQVASTLQSQGIDFKPAKIDFFETQNMIDKMSPAQKAELKSQGLI